MWFAILTAVGIAGVAEAGEHQNAPSLIAAALGLVAMLYGLYRLLPAGTVLHSIMWHDNTVNNKFNPDPDAQITYGGRTVDEMASAWISWYYMSDQDYKKETEARKSRQTLTSSR